MTLDSKPSTPDPPNAAGTSHNALVINNDDKIEATEKFLKEYYDAKIDNNNPDFPMLQETVKK